MEGPAVLGLLDIFVIVLYFVLIAALSMYISVRNRSQEEIALQDGESEAFFLAGRTVSWIGVGCSLFMSNIGSEHFVALAGSGATSGLAVSTFEWLAAIFISLVLGQVFVPFYMSTRVKTIPEFLGLRFSPGSRLYIAMVSVFTGVVIKICVILYSGALVLQVLLGWNSWISLAAIVLGTCVYSVIGGLEAVILTEIVQAVVLLCGGIPLAVLSLHAVGGWSQLRASLITESADREYMMHLLQPAKGVAWVEFPWVGLLLGLPSMELWYWCTDQTVVQRAISAKSVNHAKGGCVLTAIFKLFIPFMMVVPGMCARVLYDDVKDEPNLAFPMLVANLLPRGLLGLMVAAMLAALMSSLASTYNSTSTIIAYDFYKRLRPHTSEHSLVFVGRVAIVVVTFVGILWIPVVHKISSGLYVYIQSVVSYVAPPIAVVYLAGVTWQGATPTAALCTLFLGGSLGLARFCVEIFVKSMDPPPQNRFLSVAVYSNFLLFAFFSTCVSAVVLVGLSLITTPTDQEKLDVIFVDDTKGIDPASYSMVDSSMAAEDEDVNGSEHQHFGASTGRSVNDDRSEEIEAETARYKRHVREPQSLVVSIAITAQTAMAAAIFWHFR